MTMRRSLMTASVSLAAGLFVLESTPGGFPAENPRQPVADLVRRALGAEDFALQDLDLPPGDPPRAFSAAVERDGRRLMLHLEAHSLRGAAFQVLLQEAGGELVPHAPPPSRTYRGRMAGEPGTVAASLLAEGLLATVLSPRGASWSIHPLRLLDARAPRAQHVVYRRPEGAFLCGTGGREDPGGRGKLPSGPRGAAESAGGAAAGTGGGDGSCTVAVADIAFDSDYEFFADDCEGDPDTCVAIVEQGLNVTNAIYTRDVKITHRLSTVVVRSDPETDFYARFPDASNFGAMLEAFRAEWNANMTAVAHDVAYLLTGKPNPQYGGLAYVGVVCTSSHYGMGIGGWGYEGIFRHEVGHNWGAGHSCGTERRYIMCGNSIPAISAYNIRVMAAHRDSRSCLDREPHASEPAPPFARLDRVITRQGEGPVAIPAVEGDTDPNCDRLRLGSFSPRSAFGARVEALDPVDPAAPEALLYIPRVDLVGTDTIPYSVADGAGFETPATVLVEVRPRALVVYLRLDETSGTDAADASGFGHGGELRGDLSFATDSVAGRHGRALRFSAIEGEYLSLGDHPDFDLERGLTVAAWFRVDGFGGAGETIAAKGSDAWRLKLDTTARALKLTCTGVKVEGSSDGSVRGTIPVDDGVWHHAAGVYDGTRISLYIDGEPDASRPASGLVRRNSDSVHIGDLEWKGAIDEVRIYNYGLSATEVRELFFDARVENPQPADGAAGVPARSVLSWLEAATAEAYDVYLGTERDSVAAATTGSLEYRGRSSAAAYRAALEPDRTYYWRIDPVGGGESRQGPVRLFRTAFAASDFDEPRPGAASYRPAPGAVELGFETVWAPTTGSDPFAGVIETSSTPTTPVFSHRSVEAATTFDAVDLEERGPAAVSLILQVRNTGYEDEDWLEVAVTDGSERVELLRLEGGAALGQSAGTGYATFAATVPAEWRQASLVLASASNSSRGSERFDFDQVGFSCLGATQVIASTYFREPRPGPATYVPGAGARELGFFTDWMPTGGARAFAGVAEAPGEHAVRSFSYRSVDATTTFDTVDLRSWRNVWVTAVVRVRSTAYESDDFLRLHVTDGAERVALLDLDGGTGLDDLADGTYRSFRARVPEGWERAALVVASRGDSSAGSEQYDLRAVEFWSRPPAGTCGSAGPAEPVFRRADANGDGRVNLTDGVNVLEYLFRGRGLGCLDAADSNDSGTLDLTDGVRVFTFLFRGGEVPPPGVVDCGPDPTADGLDCAGYDCG